MRDLASRSLVPAALLAVAAAAWPASAQPEQPPGEAPAAQATRGSATGASATPAAPTEFDTFRARFEGEWRLTTPQDQARQRVDAAIDETVNAMNFFLRSVARGQLADNTPINRRISLTFLEGDRIRVEFHDTSWRTTSRVGRTVRARSSDDVEMRVTQRFQASGALEQVFATDQGTRWNTYTSTGADTMRIDAVTQGMMMPQPMRFSLDYARQR